MATGGVDLFLSNSCSVVMQVSRLVFQFISRQLLLTSMPSPGSLSFGIFALLLAYMLLLEAKSVFVPRPARQIWIFAKIFVM